MNAKKVTPRIAKCIKKYHQIVLRSRLQRLVQVAVRPTEKTRRVEDMKG